MTEFDAWGALILLGVLSVAPAAHGDVTACVTSHASGQRAAKDGQLKRASELFTACGAGTDCPSEIRTECVELYAEVQRSLPTVIFSAVNPKGADVTDVRVFSGNTLVSAGLDGRAVAVDPGKHRFRFVFASGEHVESDILVREGDKNRVVVAREQGLAAAHAVPSPGASNGLPSGEQRSLPAGFWVATAVGAAALGSWSVFALLGNGEKNKIDACSPNCPESRRSNYDALRRNYLIADVSLGVAVASAGVATWLLLSQRSSSTSAQAPASNATAALRSVSLLPVLSATGAGLWISADAL